MTSHACWAEQLELRVSRLLKSQRRFPLIGESKVHSFQDDAGFSVLALLMIHLASFSLVFFTRKMKLIILSATEMVLGIPWDNESKYFYMWAIIVIVDRKITGVCLLRIVLPTKNVVSSLRDLGNWHLTRNLAVAYHRHQSQLSLVPIKINEECALSNALGRVHLGTSVCAEAPEALRSFFPGWICFIKPLPWQQGNTLRSPAADTVKNITCSQGTWNCTAWLRAASSFWL